MAETDNCPGPIEVAWEWALMLQAGPEKVITGTLDRAEQTLSPSSRECCRRVQPVRMGKPTWPNIC